MTSFSNIRQNDFVLKGTGNNVNIRARCPDTLRQDLFVKRVACQSVSLTTNSIPRFIPELASEARKAYTNGATSITWDNLGTNNFQVISNTDYFVNVRNLSNTACYTSTVFWSNVNNIDQPPFYVPDDQSIYYLPYYYCYDITLFYEMVEEAANVGLAQALGVIVDSLPHKVTLIYDAESSTVNFSVPLLNAAEWNFEFSPSLAKLMGMATTNVNYGTYVTKQLKWSLLLTTINSATYVNASAKLQQNMLPFDRYVVASDLPVTPVEFSVSTDPLVSSPFEIQALTMWRDTEMSLQSGKTITISFDNILERQKTFEDATYGNSQIQFRLMLRSSRNQVWIEWILPIGEKLELTLNTYRLF
jgi:hypothetical protein